MCFQMKWFMKRDWVLEGKMWFVKMIILYEIMYECKQRPSSYVGIAPNTPMLGRGNKVA